MKHLLATTLAVAVLGFVAGSLGPSIFEKPSENSGFTATSRNGSTKIANTDHPAPLKSSDTAASLAELPATELYPRLALWMLDASASEIREFWTAYVQGPNQSPALTELIFINWTRLDPEGAIAATKGTQFEKIAWSAWTCNNPDQALREALLRHPGDNEKGPISAVMKSLGKFHPTWLREHFDNLPEKWMQQQALVGYTGSPDSENPRESIAFLRKQGWSISSETLAAFGRESPLEAFRLVMELKGIDGSYRYKNQPDDLIIAVRLLSEKASFAGRSYEIASEHQHSYLPIAASPSTDLLKQLLTSDPQALMEATLTSEQENPKNYRAVGAAWAKQNLPEYGAWVATQKDSEIYQESAASVTNQLIREGHDEEAMEWAESIPTDQRNPSFMVTQAYRHWLYSEPEAAKAWKERTTHSEAQLKRLNQVEREAP